MGEACGTGDESGGGGSGGCGGSGGAGGEPIGVAVEADTGCCCSVDVEGHMHCTVGDPNACPPYTTNTPGACGGSVVGGCSASGVPSGAGGATGVEGFVLLLALAAFHAMRRRFA